MRRLTLALAMVVFALPAAAQKTQPRCSDEQPQGADQKTKYEVVIGPDGKKIFRIKTGFVICGKVPKPEILYGLLSSTINYEWESLKQDFLPKVFHSVEDSPF